MPHWVPGEGVTGRGPWRAMHVVPCAGRPRSTCMMQAEGEGLGRRPAAAGTRLGLAPSSLLAAGAGAARLPPSLPALGSRLERAGGKEGASGVGEQKGREQDRGCR